MKKNIYVISNYTLKRDGNIIKIDNSKIPISLIHNIFIIGKATISRSAQNLLLKNNKMIFFLDNQYRLIGILSKTIYDSDYNLRLKQYQKAQNIKIASFIVKKKIEAIAKTTQKSMDRYLKKIDKVSSINELLGIEGIASNYMFAKFKERLEENGIYEFSKRSFRPAPDRVNALLSFLYTLYYSLAYAMLIGEKLDPYIGFLHTKRGKHAACASDIMEEARVYLTFLAIDILKEILEEFNGKYLTYKGLKKVLNHFDNFVQNYQNNLIKEIKEML